LKEWQKTIHHYGTLLQTDVKLHSGCSGGALLSLEGKLIGLTTAHAALFGLDVPGGFAVPMDGTMRQIVEILGKGEEVEYGFLGVSFHAAKKPGKGVILSHVIDGSPADLAGLRIGDTLLAIGDQSITSSENMFLALSSLFAGTKVKLEVRKAGKKFDETVQVVLMKSHVAGKTIAANSRHPFFRGLRADYTSLAVQSKFPGYNHEHIPKGVLITEVQVNSPAATALLKPGEIITHVNNLPVEMPDQFYQLVQNMKGEVTLTLISLNGLPAPKVTIN
jgi:serine protease Do